MLDPVRRDSGNLVERQALSLTVIAKVRMEMFDVDGAPRKQAGAKAEGSRSIGSHRGSRSATLASDSSDEGEYRRLELRAGWSETASGRA